MPGNESDVLEFIFRNKGSIRFDGIDKIESIKVPQGNSLIEINKNEDLLRVDSSDSTKKADFYLNNIGISVKQEGSSCLYNKAQRKHLKKFFENFFSDIVSAKIIKNLDMCVDNFHNKQIIRDVQYSEIMTEPDFKTILRHLMLEGYSNLNKKTNFKAKQILVAKKNPSKREHFHMMSFENFFEAYKSLFVFAIRPIWIGQLSDSEHGRALSISRDPINQKWVYNNVSGQPRARDGRRWREDIDKEDRKTVYYININIKSM